MSTKNNRATAPKIEPEFNRAELYRALDIASSLGLIKRAVRDTAKQLVRFIPISAQKPISPVRVGRLAAEEGASTRTIYNHIQTLIRVGFAQNRTLDGGHRSFDHEFGEITFISGIDLSPLEDALPQLLHAWALREAERTEKDAVRKRISVVRRRIKVAIRSLDAVPDAILERFDALPRRIANLGTNELLELLTISVDILEELKSLIVKCKNKESYQSENNDLLYTNTNNSIVICNKGKPLIENAKETLEAEIPSIPDTSDPAESTEKTTDEVISLDLVANAAPPEWIEDIKALYGDVTWQNLHYVAAARADANGIYASLWSDAVASFGQDIPTILSLVLDHYGPSGTDHIKNPIGWLKSMLKRVEAGQANLGKSLFGIVGQS